MSQHAPERARRSLVESILHATTVAAARFPLCAPALCLGLAAACTLYTRDHLTFKTSRADLIDPSTEYHQRWMNYTREFGDVTEDMVVVVEAPDADTIQRTLDDLGRRLEDEQSL